MDPVTQQFIADMLPYLAAIEDAARQAKDFAAANLEAAAAVKDMRDAAVTDGAALGDVAAEAGHAADEQRRLRDDTLTAAEALGRERDEALTAAAANADLAASSNAAAGAGGMGALLKAALALAPVLLGLLPAVGSAALGFGAFAAFAMPALLQVKDGLTQISQAQQAVDTATTAASRNTALAKLRADWAAMPAPIRETVQSIQAFAHQFSQLAASSGVQTAFLHDIQQVMGILRTLLPDIVPLAKAGAAAFGDMLHQIQQMASAPDTKQFFTQMAAMVGPAVHGITELALTLSKLLGGALQALAPLMKPALDFINTLATALSQLLANGPGNGILGQLAPLFGQILSALTPLIGPLEQLINSVLSSLIIILRPLIPLLAQVATIIAGALLQSLNAAAPGLRQIATDIAQLIVAATPLITLLAKWVVAQAPLIGMIINLAAAILTDLMPLLIPLVQGISKIAEVAIPPVIKAMTEMMSVTRTVFGFIASFVKSSVDTVKGNLMWFSGLAGLMAGWWHAAVNAASQEMANLIMLAHGLPMRILSALGNLGSLLFNAGVAVIQGLISGITSMIGSLISTLGSIAGIIASHKGPIEADRQLLVPHGQAIMAGLMDGIASRRADLAAMLGALTSGIPAMAAAGSYGGEGGGISVTVPVTVQGQLGAAGTQQLQAVIQTAVLDYFTRTGSTGLVPFGRE